MLRVQQVSKALKKNKLYGELKLLSDFEYLSYVDYPHKFEITQRGFKSLGED